MPQYLLTNYVPDGAPTAAEGVRRRSRLDAALAGVTVVASCALVFWLRDSAFDWSSWSAASCMPGLCFCEADRLFHLRQPMNTISSCAFGLVGAVVVLTRSRAADRSEDKYLFWLAASLIGLGSAFYHATLTLVGQTFDVVGMYLLATLLLLWSVQPRLQWRVTQRVIAYVLGNAALLALLIVVPEVRRYVFAGLMLAILLLQRRTRRTLRSRQSPQFLVWAVGLLLVGFAVWITDITKTLCDPTSAFQGHAVWHVLGAASSFMIYKHYHPAGPPRRGVTV